MRLRLPFVISLLLAIALPVAAQEPVAVGPGSMDIRANIMQSLEQKRRSGEAVSGSDPIPPASRVKLSKPTAMVKPVPTKVTKEPKPAEESGGKATVKQVDPNAPRFIAKNEFPDVIPVNVRERILDELFPERLLTEEQLRINEEERKKLQHYIKNYLRLEKRDWFSTQGDVEFYVPKDEIEEMKRRAEQDPSLQFGQKTITIESIEDFEKLNAELEAARKRKAGQR